MLEYLTAARFSLVDISLVVGMLWVILVIILLRVPIPKKSLLIKAYKESVQASKESQEAETCNGVT